MTVIDLGFMYDLYIKILCKEKNEQKKADVLLCFVVSGALP